MKKLLCLILMSLSLVGCSASNICADSRIVLAEDMNVQTIASLIKPAIVGIEGLGTDGDSVGSGVCVAPGGYILTNSHVINDCDKIVLYLSNGDKSNARLIFEDTVSDLAILKSDLNLPYLSIGDSDDLCVGEDVLAVGTPLSLILVHTFTKGIVSALNRTLKVSSVSGDGYMQNLIQHDASLNPGNSGGPLINSKGEVVGINTLKISGGEGIGFAIPSKSFRSLLNSYVNKIDYKIPYLGVYGVDSEIAKFNGKTDIKNGFYVISVADNSPLKNIGMKNDSIITAINGRQINNALDLRDELYKLNKGDVVRIDYVENNQSRSSHIKVS